MSGIYLPRLFPPHIAERGLLYFQQGKVRDVQKTSAGRYRAEVCGSENPLWNQIRADVLGLPIDVVDVAESTVLGAAMFTFAGIGIYETPEQAQQAMQPNRKRVNPARKN